MHSATVFGFLTKWKLPAVVIAALIGLSLIVIIPFILDDQAGMTLRSSEERQPTSATAVQHQPVVSADAVRMRARHAHSQAAVDVDAAFEPTVNSAAIQLRARQNHGATGDQVVAESGSPRVSASAVQLRARNLHGNTLVAQHPTPSASSRFDSN